MSIMVLLDLPRFVSRGLCLNRLSRADRPHVAPLQRHRLRTLVQLAVRRSPFYRRKFAGIDPDRFRLADLPTTSKEEVMAHFEDAFTVRGIALDDLQRFMADPDNVASYYQGRYVLSHTSGSQGQPIIVVQDRRCLELFFLLQMTRGNASGQSGIWETARRLLRPARLAVIILERGFYPSCATFSHIPEEMRAFVKVRPLSMTDPLLVQKLNDYQPTVLAGFANVLARLARETETGRLRLGDHLRHMVNHSETLTPAARQRLRSVFGVPVLNNYATAECPFLSNGCPTDPGAHINADCCIVEVVDEDNRPVAAGQQGKKILLTNLANTVQPFIRYEVHDAVTLAAEPCHCGSRLPRILDIDGRRSEDFWVGDGNGYRLLPAFVFKKALLYTPEVREWQAVQAERNAFELRLEVLPGATLDAPRARDSIERHLEMYGFKGTVTFQLHVVPRLESDPGTGKLKQTVSLVGPPNVPAG